jgi:hypothetical protein
MPAPPQTIDIRITLPSHEVLTKANRHKDEPIYAVVNRILESYREIKNGYDSEAEELKEWLELANNDKAEYRKEIERLRSKIKDLEESNYWLTDKLYYLDGIKREVKISNAIN